MEPSLSRSWDRHSSTEAGAMFTSSRRIQSLFLTASVRIPSINKGKDCCQVWSGLARTEQLCLLHTIFTGQPLLHRNPDVVTQPVLAQSLEHLGPADQHHHPHLLALQVTFSMFLKLEKRSSKFKINEKFTILWNRTILNIGTM
jgi:hypothetical protein